MNEDSQSDGTMHRCMRMPGSREEPATRCRDAVDYLKRHCTLMVASITAETYILELNVQDSGVDWDVGVKHAYFCRRTPLTHLFELRTNFDEQVLPIGRMPWTLFTRPFSEFWMRTCKFSNPVGFVTSQTSSKRRLHLQANHDIIKQI